MQDRLVVNGVVTSDGDTILQCWVEHFQKILGLEQSLTKKFQRLQMKFMILLLGSFLNAADVLDDSFSVEEIEAAIKKLKNGKSGGVDGLLPEHLKYGGPALTLWLTQVQNAFIKLEHVAHSLLTGKLTPIYKDKGKDPLNCISYRGIAMMSVIMKTFEYAILQRILT